MRVGVTGSSGFIGSALIEALRERGDQVVRFVRPDSAPTSDTVVRWDPNVQLVDEGDLRRLGGFDAVVNLAGTSIGDRRWSSTRKSEIAQSRISATNLLARTLSSMASGPPYVASGSAVGYYGSRGDELLNETSGPGDDFLADVCIEWEAATASLARAGATVAHLRTGIVMSAHGGALKKQLPLFRLGLGGRLASGRQWLSPISLHDQIRAILWVLDHQLPGPINLCAPIPLTNRDFTRALARELRRPALARVPSVALNIALGGELTRGAVLASQRVLPMTLLTSGFKFDHPGISSILRQSAHRGN